MPRGGSAELSAHTPHTPVLQAPLLAPPRYPCAHAHCAQSHRRGHEPHLSLSGPNHVQAPPPRSLRHSGTLRRPSRPGLGPLLLAAASRFQQSRAGCDPRHPGRARSVVTGLPRPRRQFCADVNGPTRPSRRRPPVTLPPLAIRDAVSAWHPKRMTLRAWRLRGPLPTAVGQSRLRLVSSSKDPRGEPWPRSSGTGVGASTPTLLPTIPRPLRGSRPRARSCSQLGSGSSS